MARSNITGCRLDNVLLMEKIRYGVVHQTITGTFTIDDDSPPFIALSAAAPQDVTLPAVAFGLHFYVASVTGGSTLTVKNAGGSTIGAVPSPGVEFFFCDGTAWYASSATAISGTDLVLTGNLSVAGNTDLGNAVSDTIGFYGATKVAQPASASQGAVTVTLVTAVAITAATAAGTTAATKTTPAGFTTTTQANKIRALVNQCAVDLATLKARVDQARVDITAVNVLATAIRAAMVPTSGLGIMKGGA